jgi:NSS family neurotransmitter:Na+ symporter
VAYPTALSLLPGGAIFGVLFFTSLVVAGLSSSVSIIEAFSSAAVDKFPWNRKRIVTCISVLGMLGSIIFTTNGGLFWLDIVDHFITHFGLITVGIIEAVLVSWFFPIETLRKHINTVSDFKIGLWWSKLIQYFVPLILLIITGTNLVNEFQKPYEGYSVRSLIFIGINWLVITLLIALFFSRSRWKNQTERRH